MNIYVGNLSWNLKDQDLSNLFASHGEVISAKIVNDKFTNRSKGFGFVEMANDAEAQAAIAALNGSEVDGRNIVVNESRPKPEGGGGGGGGFKKRSFGGGGGGGGYKKSGRAAAAADTTKAVAVDTTVIAVVPVVTATIINTLDNTQTRFKAWSMKMGRAFFAYESFYLVNTPIRAKYFLSRLFMLTIM